MPPHYERCGDIVWHIKRETCSFAFKCIYCEHQTTAFRDFKQHLAADHAGEMQTETQMEPARNQPLRNLHIIQITSIKNEPKPEATEEPEQRVDPLEKRQVLAAAAQPELHLVAEVKLNMPSSGHSAGSCNNISINSEELATTDNSHFWLRQHPIMRTLIELMESARLLWDSGVLDYRNYKRRGEACEQIARQLNARFQLQLKSQEISDYVKMLRTIHAQEQRRQQQQLTDQTPAPWYYERLQFLGNSVRKKRCFKAHTATALPVPQLTDEQNLKFIELYRRTRRIWDMHDLNCRLRHVRLAAKQTLLQLCRSELHLEQLGPAQLQSYITQLRRTYAQEKLRRLECERNNRPYAARCRYQQQLLFLDEHMPPFRCAECGQTVSSVDRYKVHCAQHEGSLPFVCPICKRGFARSDNCTIHLRRHTHDYQLACEACGKRFANTTDLHVHRRQHTGEKPYCCEICGSRFTTSSFFERHRRRHQQRPKGKCHLCGKTFFEQSVLNDHIKGHLNVRDKVCDVCEKGFTSAKYLRQHKEIHAPQKRYICKICDKAFAQYAGLSGHMRSHRTTEPGAVNEEEIDPTVGQVDQ